MLTRRTVLGSMATMGFASRAIAADPPPRFRLGVVGLVHGHVGGLFDKVAKRNDVQVVGIVEPSGTLVGQVLENRHLPPEVRFKTVDEMVTRARPDALVVYTNTFDHLAVIKAAAARGVPVMVEKPLAVSVAHGREIAAAAARGKIHVLVNYETTWYPTHALLWTLAKTQGRLGNICKMVAHDGHSGPKEIGIGPEFLGWLTDPVKNGAGALYDFGCYGANLITWLMDGRRPTSVTAMVQRQKPEIYARVDDESTILVAYPGAQGIIQGSWNWPYSRKDLEVYGDKGYAIAVDRTQSRVRIGGAPEDRPVAAPLVAPQDDYLSYLMAVVRGQVKPEGLSSLENNLVVTEILDAARRSAETGRTIKL